MPKVSLETLGLLVNEKRGKIGVRATAQEIGISPATLSRIEHGNLPDIDTFTKVCRWLGIDPGAILGFKVASSRQQHSLPSVAVHFRKKSAVKMETAKALAEMILAAQRAHIAIVNSNEGNVSA